MILYELTDTDAGESITCYLCQRRSHNINDVRERYCGQCNRFLADLESQGLAALCTAVSILRPDLSLEAQGQIVQVLAQVCSPRLNPQWDEPEWMKNKHGD